MKDIKVIIGANYGDEGKGLATRHFVQEAVNPIVILHNGTAQRGHTVDYNPGVRHVYHHFGSGTADNAPTFFASSFLLHPMAFGLEWMRLEHKGVVIPIPYYDPNCFVITPFDMMVDHATEDYIAWEHGEREHGSCGLGSWCATDRFPIGLFTAREWNNAILNREYGTKEEYRYMMDTSFNECVRILQSRGVDLDKIPKYQELFDKRSGRYQRIVDNFINDLNFMFFRCKEKTFDQIYEDYDSLIFENGQGLGLDKNVENDWHTTSNTGLTNPVQMLKDKDDFNAEVCYITRSYLTRHGVGPLEEAVHKAEINADMKDLTNVPNEFQGSLRYGYLDDCAQALRIGKDWTAVKDDSRFKKTMMVTHCNEFKDMYEKADYVSYNPYSVLKR